MSNQDLFTRLIRYFIGLGVGGALGFLLAQMIIADQPNDASLAVVALSIILFFAGFFAGLFSVPGDAKPFTIKLTLVFFFAGLGLSLLALFLGFGLLEDMGATDDPLEGIGLLIIGILLIVLAIGGAIATVIGSIVLIIGSLIGEALSKSLFHADQTFDKPTSRPVKSESKSKYCKSCGTRMRSNERVCPSCGSKS
jgi:hypothetical protein